VFNQPRDGGFEITEMMLAALIYCGLPLVSQRREHIVIDTFDHFMSRRVKRGSTCGRDRVQRLAVGIACCVPARGARARLRRHHHVLKLPLAPVAYSWRDDASSTA
jgi:TRAP-type C4-dicarboxylate transport system permease small subunit